MCYVTFVNSIRTSFLCFVVYLTQFCLVYTVLTLGFIDEL